MRKVTALVLVGFFLLSLISCAKSNSNQDNTANEYEESDVRNRNLKEAVGYYNDGFLKAADSSISRARAQSLRDEDIVIMDEIDLKIDQKTKLAVLALDSLAMNKNHHDYDSAYNTLHSNYEISSFRQKIEETKEKYLAFVKSDNDVHLGNYYKILQEIEAKTSLSLENSAKAYLSKTSPLKLKIIKDGYKSPEIYLEFNTFQKEKEPELETIKFISPSTTIIFEKQAYIINEYNNTIGHTLSFDLANKEEKMNLATFKQMLDDGKITIALKWFYEPETITVSASNISKLKEILQTYQELLNEYNAQLEHIYIPKYVR